MPLRIVITGAGIISAAGVGWKETSGALKSGLSNIGPLRFLDTIHKEIPCAEVPYSDEELISIYTSRRKSVCQDECYPTFSEIIGNPETVVPRSSLLGMIAADEAVTMAGIRGFSARVAFLNGTTVGVMDITERNFSEYLNGSSKDEYLKYHCDGVSTRIIADSLGIDIEYLDVVSTACSAAANAIAMGAELIRLGRADIVVAGGAECITKYHFNGFNSLMILDKKPCRPFDADRDGLNLGEGAGYIVLESEEFAAMRGAHPIAELSGWGNACDAYHQTATSEDGKGAFLSMSRALEVAGLNPSDIDYINAHGTGTPNNDLTEGVAIQRLFGKNIPPVSSTKGLTGHPTSAAAGVEAVISLIALNEGFIPANLRFENKSPELNFIPVVECIEGVKLNHILSNSFGFGGNDSTLIFSSLKAAGGNGSVEDECGKRIYINGAAIVGVERGEDGDFYVKEPDYKGVISPIAARRLSKVIKRTYYTAVTALRESGVTMPDAVITGTGLGCTDDTIKFLKGMVENGENFLSPSLFITSTPNTIGSSIAMMLKCHGFNNTHVNDAMAFEGALLESFMLLQKTEYNNVLLNSADETPEPLRDLLKKSGCFFDDPISEGSCSFVLSHNPERAAVILDDVLMFALPKECDDEGREGYLKRVFANFLLANGLKESDINALYVGENPHSGNCCSFLPADIKRVDFKKECGEYLTASAYGLYNAVAYVSSHKEAGHVVCVSQSGGGEYAFVLLTKV